MLVTQNQSSLSWNSNFNKQEQGNSNEVFNLEFPSEIEISSDTKTAKKLEINGIEYLEFPSSNVEINSVMNSAVSSATAVNQTTATAYGYSVDSKGFMGADFNKAVGINENIKIHSKTIEQLTTHAKNIGFNGSAVEITKKAWSNFSQIIGDESALRGEKALDKNSQIAYSFNTDSGILGNFTSVHTSLQSSISANNYEQSLTPLSVIEYGEISFNPLSNYSGFTMLGFSVAFNSGEYSQIDLMNKQISDELNIENKANSGEMDIGIAFHSFIESGSFVNHSKSIALGDEYRASGKSLKDFIISNVDIYRLKIAISKFSDVSIKQLTSLDEILLKM
ncbi:hypothetical protein [Campylobacter lanienae]|uniref:hypothetical protein n=1 Tax=Campylobacter lanienae TaxID=75658 RepID=UPI002A91B87B|nr:hypothetical protein [Campylobacter lanienae]MDY6134099.1 hypothetical protein [Campylobacter lanienae]